MGRDKARLSLGAKTLLEHSLEVLAEVSDEVCLSVGQTSRYPEAGAREVLDRRTGGPLAGLEAVLSQVGPDEPVAVLACDLPRAKGAVFDHLLERIEADGLDGCLLATSAGLEPLYAVYLGRCREAVSRALDAGERRMISFHENHGPVSIGTLPVSALPRELADCAVNVNTPSDWKAEVAS